MKPFPPRTLLSLLVLGCGAVCALAQTAGPGSAPGAAGGPEDLHGLKIRELHPRATPTPFPLDARSGRWQELEFRAPEAMTAADRDLVAANEGEIARRAELQGFRLDGDSGPGGWGYEQAVCPVFPDHVILEYSRVNGAGDVSLFSAVIPRADGHVRVIPARRRSYSLWTPVSSNALTLNDFNHMVKESPGGLNPDWLTIGLCYSALTGGHVRAGLKAESAAEETFPLAPVAALLVSRKGGAEVRFSDVTPETRQMTWVLTFAQNGRLLKVRHGDARELTERAVKGNAAEAKGVPMKQSVVDLGKPGN